MKKIIILLTVLLTIALNGCVDLNYNETSVRNEEWIFGNPNDGILPIVTDVYTYMFGEFKFLTGQYSDSYGYRGAMRCSTTDEAEFATSETSINRFYDGGWSPAYPFDFYWRYSYRAINQIHTYFEKMNQIDLEEYRYSSDFETIRRQFELFPYELRFLRAYFYFELVKAYGDVPLVTTQMTPEMANNVSRTPAQEIFDFIIRELDDVSGFLPTTYALEPASQVGRATRAAALGLKARVLLYNASPLYNKSNDRELYLKSAAASKYVIDKAAEWDIAFTTYGSLWGHDAFYNKENIFYHGMPANSTVETANYPVGIENGNSGNCPTQSLVDAYEYIDNGQTFGQRHPGQINITQENPYAGLDPRFALTIVKNGDQWPSNSTQRQTMQTYFGGANGLPKYKGTPTGYYLKKLVDGNTLTTANGATTRRHTWVNMRLAEVYLNYAEAMYYYYGNADAKGDFGMSANEAINVLRNRPEINMPNFSGNANFEERYMRERMVELAFEDHRFWDVRRWKKGNEFFVNIGVANLELQGNDVILKRSTNVRQWNDKYYFFPIPQSEINRNKNLIQNPGW